MQLFTIGLWELNLDGTRKIDSEGQDIPTYTQDDVDTFARAWTGFDLPPARSNIERKHGFRTTSNWVRSALSPFFVWNSPPV